MSNEQPGVIEAVVYAVLSLILFGGGGLAGVFALSKEFAGTPTWDQLTFVVWGLAAVMALAFPIHAAVSARRGLGDGRRLVNLINHALWAVVVGTGVWVWHTGGEVGRRAWVHVDNFSGQDARVVRDGGEWLVCANGTTQRVALANGQYVLKVMSADGTKELDRQQVTVKKGKTYVLNCLGAQRYISGDESYSTDGHSGFAPRDSRVFSETWFEATQNYVFETPPASILAPEGSQRTTKTFIRRATQEDVTEAETLELRLIGEAYLLFCRDSFENLGPTSLEHLRLMHPLIGQYDFIGRYAPDSRQSDRRVAWRRRPTSDGERLVLMGDLRTVVSMSSEEFDASRAASPSD